MARDTAAWRLTPASGVTVIGELQSADGDEPWLDVVGADVALFAGRFIEITYRASLLDEPSRPVFRFHQADGRVVDRIGAAPILGAGSWIGRVPPDTTRLSISPTNRPGPFGFVVERMGTRSWIALVREGMRRTPARARTAVLARLIGWTPESDNDLNWAIGATALSEFPAWQVHRRRAIAIDSLDKPRHDWTRAPGFCLVVTGCDNAALATRTVAGLRRQAFTRWSALLIGGQESDDPRIVPVDLHGAIERLGGSAPDEIVGVVSAGDTLPAYALAHLAEQSRRHPGCRVFYGDEIVGGRPNLKPGWSPRLFASRPALGRAVFATGLADWTADERGRFILAHALPASATTLPGAVHPVRRVLLETELGAGPIQDASCERPKPEVRTASADKAALVVLTRDHPALLDRFVASVRSKTPAGSFRLVIVDNGAPDGPAKALIDDLERAPDALVLRRRDRFNFAAFCNDAAAACGEDLLVFLNDDTAVLSDGWLERLARHAADPGIGAVGGKLTFPDGRLQHIGVVVGMGGGAGHFGAGVPGDDPGWAGRNTTVHEVAAVTGACLAVARAKFEAVGGFDAQRFPVELNDIDLCLRLGARGWRSVVDPQVHLLHEESASRGAATFRRLAVYSEERAAFAERWRHVMRDDPAFHPGLSLYSMGAALG